MNGTPAFPSNNPVPQIFPQGYGYVEEYSAVDSILRNERTLEPNRFPSRQRYVSRGGVSKMQKSYRFNLQRRIAEFLDLDASSTSVICVTSGTNALRMALKTVIADDRSEARNEVIMPAITASSTAEAVIMEGFIPVLVDVDPKSWILSPEATMEAISERTAAIVTVDWLGSTCDLRPFRKLADQHRIKLISDSAQSFGAIPGRPHAIDLADATIFSTGYPKVLQTGGAGGIVICSPSQADWLDNEPSDILRHEAMPEVNAYLGLRALDRFLQDLKTRGEAGKTYRSLLSNLPGIALQHVAPGSGATHYQMSVTVDPNNFGMTAKALCDALQAENILCNAERMLCLGSMPRLLRRCRVAGNLAVSRWLGDNSLTFPIFEQLSTEQCHKICSCVKTIHEESRNLTATKDSDLVASTLSSNKQPTITDIADKFRNYWIVPIIDEGGFAGGIESSTPWTALIQPKHLTEGRISIDELNRKISSRDAWNQGDTVIDDLVVHATVGNTGLVLSLRGRGDSRINSKLVHMDESGSSADVNMVLGQNGQAEIHKTCSHDGIDGNGRPWLERQLRFYESSVAVKHTGIFVKPLKHRVADDAVTIAFPYVPSLSLAEMALAGMNADSLLAVVTDLFGEMATHVWPHNAAPGSDNFIQEAHFDRIKRRVGIAREAMPELDDVANYEFITLNGKRMLGFERVLDALSRHPTVKEIVPRRLGEIHGDLNLHNVLCQISSDADRPIVLVDPRGVPLLHKFSKIKAFEPGDYAYEISKLKFSLSGFSDIRKGFFDVRREGESESFELLLKHHPGSDTMRHADRGLFAALSSNESFINWVNVVEPSGLRSMELRVLLGEAANFIADAACALGRAREDEVLPLFLMGIAKLNDMLEYLQGHGSTSLDALQQSIQIETPAESPNHGMAMIQSSLLGSSNSNTASTWNVLEVLVKSESTHAVHQLFSELVGDCLPDGTNVYVSTYATEHITFPCVLIHPFVGARGQTSAALSGIRRTYAFLRDGGLPAEKIDRLRIVTLTSTSASTRSQYVSRKNDRLLSPGPWGLSPLKLIVLEANQLNFPRAGRWIVENDSVFVLSRDLRPEGNSICLLTSKNTSTASDSPWNVCIDSIQQDKGRSFATGLRTVNSPETSTTSLRPTGPMFLPTDIGKSLVAMGEDYAARSSHLMVDFVLPRFMRRVDWIELCHSLGCGGNSDLAWRNAKRLASQFPQVEVAYGGDELVVRQFSSDSEYIKLLDGARNDPLLTSLACLPSTAKWLRNYPLHRIQTKLPTVTSGFRAKL